jgi:hypothetical protein
MQRCSLPPSLHTPPATGNPQPTNPQPNHPPKARGVADITAVDLSSEMLRQLAARFPPPGSVGNDAGVRPWRGDFVDLPVYMGSADAIFLNSMFGNVHDQVGGCFGGGGVLCCGWQAVIR